LEVGALPQAHAGAADRAAGSQNIELRNFKKRLVSSGRNVRWRGQRSMRKRFSVRNFGFWMAAAALLLATPETPARLRAQTATASPPSTHAPSGRGKVLTLGVAASGVVQKIPVADGAHVDAGQLLLQIDCRPLEEEIKLRAAERDAAQAAFERARNGTRLDEIAIGEANVGVATARAEEAEAAYGRLTALTEGVTVTRAQVLQDQRDARVTAAQLEDARKRLALLKAGSRPEDIAEALAKRDAAAAGLATAEARLDQCSVRAPVAGIVQVTATLGQFVSTSVPDVLLRLTADPAP
jgi:HlyD family secretion protein